MGMLSMIYVALLLIKSQIPHSASCEQEAINPIILISRELDFVKEPLFAYIVIPIRVNENLILMPLVFGDQL